MGKINWKHHSLRYGIIFYLPVFLIIAFLGTIFIGFATNDLQYWYINKHPDLLRSPNMTYEIFMDENGESQLQYTITEDKSIALDNLNYSIVYWIISYAQFILIPAWCILCIVLPSVIFYHFELKKPIRILLEASQKIANNQLDFKIEYKKQNELGMLCMAFNEMRLALYQNNQEMWRSLEERKRLNSAFSHDLRTPLTVLKGYTEFLEKYLPDGKITEEKLLSVIAMMNSQILRLEHYTQKMNAVQKLEEIVPNSGQVSVKVLFAMLRETGEVLCDNLFRINTVSDNETICLDTELVMQVYENITSNAVRYARNSVEVNASISGNTLTIAVLDDGNGFSKEGLKNALQPFFRDEKEPDKMHFGLGLYICRILCEKCGGTLTIENHENGGKVTAKFSGKKIYKSREKIENPDV